MARKFKTISYSADNVWAAAAAATRINGGYVKEARYDYDPATGETTLISEANKRMVSAMLELGQGWTDEDVVVANEARDYWKGGVMKLLTGEVKEFERMAITLADVETVDSFLNVAVISSLVASAKRGMLRDNLEQEKRFSNSEWQAAVKANIVLKDLEVLVCTYSENFASYRFEGKIDGNFFSWWGKEKIAVGTKLNGKARVKAHATDSKSGAKVTQINYLKVA